MQITATIEGARELENALKRLGFATSKGVLRSAMKKAAQPVVREMQALAPQSGEFDGDKPLAFSIIASPRISAYQRRGRGPEKGVTLFIGSTARHAHLVEFGHAIVKGKKGGRRIIGHVPAHPFARPAWRATRDQILPILGKEIWRVLLRTAKRLNRQAAAGKLSKRGRAIFE